MNEYLLILISALLSSNIVAVYGVAAIGLQSEKRKFSFMLTTTLFTILSIVIVGVLYNVVEDFLLEKYNAEFLKLFLIVFWSVVFAFISRVIIKRTCKEDYFLYEKSYGLPTQVVVCVGALLIVDFSGVFWHSLYSLAIFGAGYLMIQIFFYALYEKLDNAHVLKPARNVPLILITLSIISMIVYSVLMFF